MARKKESITHIPSRNENSNQSDDESKQRLVSKKVTDHLANERTFLAWVRTGLATITFGFVVERFGLLLRELGLRNISVGSQGYSTLIGVSLTILGVIVIIVSLLNFLTVRRSIDREQFHPQAGFSIALTILAALIGVLLAVYLFFTD